MDDEPPRCAPREHNSGGELQLCTLREEQSGRYHWRPSKRWNRWEYCLGYVSPDQGATAPIRATDDEAVAWMHREEEEEGSPVEVFCVYFGRDELNHGVDGMRRVVQGIREEK